MAIENRLSAFYSTKKLDEKSVNIAILQIFLCGIQIGTEYMQRADHLTAN